MTAPQNATATAPRSVTQEQAAEALEFLRPYMPAGERSTLCTYCNYGEEREHFRRLVATMAERIRTMPATRGQAHLDDPIVYLHYFHGGMDFHITEKDCEAEQHQAFGLANLGYGGELGYISIVELVENKIELDLYFEPTPLSKVMED